MVGGIGRQTEESIYSGFNICINKTAGCRSVRWGVSVETEAQGSIKNWFIFRKRRRKAVPIPK